MKRNVSFAARRVFPDMEWYHYRAIAQVYIPIYLGVYALHFWGPPQSEIFLLTAGGIVMAAWFSYTISKADHYERVIFQHLNMLYEMNLDQRNLVHRARTHTITPQYLHNDPFLQQAYQNFMQHTKLLFFHLISFGILVVVGMTVAS